MLKSVVFQNFIHFEEHQHIAFKEGCNFIIGHNGSGKSAFFELIRRCMYEGINTSWSSVFETSNYAYVFCMFDNITGLYPEENQQNYMLLSGLVYDPGNDSECKIYKIGQVHKKEKKQDVKEEKNHDDEEEKKMDHKKEMKLDRKKEMKLDHKEEMKLDHKKEMKLDHKEEMKLDKTYCDMYVIRKEDFSRMNEKERGMFRKLEGRKSCNTLCKSPDLLEYLNQTHKKRSESTHNEILQCIRQMIELTGAQEEEGTQSQLEELLKSLTNKYYTQTFALHGLSNMQWTRSRRMGRDQTEENYNECFKNAEILVDLLESKNVNKGQAEEYMDFLTYPKKYTFKKMEKIEVKDGKYTFNLMKVPGGILEAQQLALLLACKDLHTLCLEEPDKSMHPQMVERIIEMLRHVEGKVIIVQSNNQLVVTRHNMHRTFIFRRKTSNGPKAVCFVKTPMEIKTNLTDSVLRLPFADFALLVEGPYDKIFLKRMIEEQSKKEKDRIFRNFLCTLQIVELGGKDQAENVKSFVETIGMENQTFYVFDRDKFYVPLQRANLNSLSFLDFKNLAEKGYFRKGSAMFLNETVADTFEIDRQNGCASHDSFEKRNIFYWEHGNIEDMIRAMIVKSIGKGHEYKGEEFKTIKRVMKEKISGISDIAVLAKLVCNCPEGEGERLFRFLKEMMTKCRFA